MSWISRWFRVGSTWVLLSLLGSGCVIDFTDLGDDARDNDEEASDLIGWTLPLAGETAFRLVGADGGVVVIGEEGSEEVRIQARRMVRSDTRSDALAHLSLLQVRIHRDGGEIRVETDQPNHSGGRSYTVDYEIHLPACMSVKVTTGNGGLHAEGLHGGLAFELGNGSAILRRVEGPVHAAVGNGGVDADLLLPIGACAVFAVGNGWVDLSVQSEVSAVLSAKVGNGSISLSNLTLLNQTSTNGQLSGLLGSGEGLIDLSVGNGWVAIKGK